MKILHPGEVIVNTYIKYGGYTLSSLAKHIGISEPELKHFLFEQGDLTNSILDKLETKLPQPRQLWLNLFNNWKKEKDYER